MKATVKKFSVYAGSLLVGGVSGLLGGGGGMLAVPLLCLNGLDEKRAHATALLIILPLCILSASIYIANGYFEWKSVLCACLGVTAGGAAGAGLLKVLDQKIVSVLFALLMIAMGIKSVL